MAQANDGTAITVAEVRALARVADLPLDDERAARLARALEGDLRIVRPLRAVEVGETFPAEMIPLIGAMTPPGGAAGEQDRDS